jgi:long-chain acyl-CoA synthetase
MDTAMAITMDRPWFKSYEPGVPHTINYPAVPMHARLEDSAKKFPDNTATIFLDHKLTYGFLDATVNRLANALAAMGVKKGDRVAIYMANCPQYIISYYATLKLGGIVVPVNPLYVAREVEHQLKDSGAETVVVMSRFYNVVQQVRSKTAAKNVIVTNIKEYFPPVTKLLFTLVKEKAGGDRVELAAEDHEWAKVISTASETRPVVAVAPSDTACLQYTGGTTGVSKGAELSHRNILANALQCRAWFTGLQEGKEIVVTVLPLFHSFGMTTCMNFSIDMGAAMVLIPNPRDLTDVLKNIAKHKPTIFPGVPTMYVGINNFPDTPKYDLRSVKACISGAAGLPVEVQKRFQEITGASLVEGYGLSEASPVTHANPIYNGGGNRIGTIGLPFPDTDARIVDLETGSKDLPPGEEGELAVRAPQVMKGYWNRPDETANVLRDGWLFTGDIGRMDADGYFQIVDRKKDMIIAGGYNIYPRDVEEVIYQNPKVLEVVVAGIPDPYRGESVKAYIILKPGQTATEQEIIDFCKDKLAKFKVPRSVEFRDTLPKSMVGKILRRILVEEEKKKQAAAGPAAGAASGA